MTTSYEMQALIKQWEGLRLAAYRCESGVLTIGYGHTGPDVTEKMTITRRQADILFATDIARCERGLSEMLADDGIPHLTQGQFDALISFSFNIGLTGLRRSTLWRKLRERLTPEEIAAEFSRWVYAGGVKQPGLVSRREAEKQIFLATPK